MIQNTARVMDALVFAEECHRGQVRKCRNVPYIVHPMMVALLVQGAGGTEDQIIAALLHDVVEDCGITLETLKNKFGPLVAAMVGDLSERDKTLPWEVRKEEAINHVDHMHFPSVLVKTADVLHNVQDTLLAIGEKGDEAFAYFKAPKHMVIDRYSRIAKALMHRMGGNALACDLLCAVQQLQKFVSS